MTMMGSRWHNEGLSNDVCIYVWISISGMACLLFYRSWVAQWKALDIDLQQALLAALDETTELDQLKSIIDLHLIPLRSVLVVAHAETALPPLPASSLQLQH